MKKKTAWFVLSCLIVSFTLLVSCTSAVVEEEEESVAILGEKATTQPLPTPASFSVSDISIQPVEAKLGEAVTITASVANVGDAEGSYTIVLNINGAKEAEKSVTIAGGNTETVIFTVTKDEAKTYSITADGLTA
ncbi:CARDB domain-containing protein, partial [Chloroflexota bacterium]